MTGQRSTRRQTLARAYPIRIPHPRTIAICVAYASIGFTPIGALALTIGGLWSLAVGSLVLIAPAVVAAIVLGVLFPRHGRFAAEGVVAGLAAVLVYDVVRWTFVGLGWWGDFIPNIGGWLNGTGRPDWILGYAFRWFGDGGGMGLAFMVAARSLVPGLGRRAAVALGIAYGLAIWMCLLITLIVSPQGQTVLFPLTTVTLILSWIGHVVYGAVLGAILGRAGTPLWKDGACAATPRKLGGLNAPRTARRPVALTRPGWVDRRRRSRIGLARPEVGQNGCSAVGRLT